MEPVPREEKPNPLQDANLCSRLFFWWLNPLFITGHKRRLEEDDMYKVMPEDSSEKLGEELQWYWDKEVQKAKKRGKTPHLTKAIILCYWKSYLVFGIFTMIEETLKIIQPIFLGKIINYFENYDASDEVALNFAYCYAGALSVCTLILAIMHHLYFYHVQRAGMKLRVAMCHMIYRKALRLSNVAMAKTTTGQIVNLLSNDVNKFDQVTIFLHFLWAGPLQAVAVTVLLWMEIGPSCLAGMAVLIILLPVQTCIGRLFSSLRSKTAALTDVRIRTMNEVISGMKIIKMYAWEKSFAELVNGLRRKEIAMVMKSSYLRGLNLASFFVASKITVFMTFMAYVLLGNVISASRVFVAVSLYGAVRLTVTLFFPAAVERVSESVISIRRIKNFLMLDEVSHFKPQLHGSNENIILHVQDLTCSWDKSLETPTLQQISCTVRRGELLAVIGPVGAGKSSLLSAVLGELPKDKGLINVTGRIAYVSQQPWVFSGTVRSNILFDKEYEKEKYENVLKVCALKKDLELLANGDLTVIGDRGATLSGGQKARVNLARAVYQDADIYLLDDPLSAVDAEVGRHLFEKCICQALHQKISVLVTHQLQYLRAANQILILKDGKMVGKGTYAEFLRSGIDFASLLKKDEEVVEQLSVPGTPNLKSARNRTFSESSVLSQDSAAHSQKDGAVEQPSVAYVVQDWWLSYWANHQKKLNLTTNGNNGTNKPDCLDLNFYLGIYAGLTVATILFGIIRSLLVFQVLVNSGQNLHNKMFQSILKAPVLFFDRNPVGRILNRFSKDIGHLDDLLPLTFLDFVQTLLQICGVVAVAVAVIPWILIPLIPLFILFIFLRRYFLDTSRDIKRLESTTRSPVFSHLSSSLQGLWTIRALKAEERFQKLFDAHQDLHSEAWFLFLTTSRWFAVRLDAICAIFVIVVAFGSLLLANTLNEGQVGLALSYAITLMGTFQWGVRQSAEVENLMISVERVMEYTELEKEAPWETNKHPPPEWPNQGMIAFENVNFTYSLDGPLVLRHLSVLIKPKEKVGIVGRTGAGKSSLIAALFRLAEPEGRIWIDKYLTSELGLHDLRKKISIIPQEPVLFTGTMRKNLDPFNEYTDEELWNALEEVQLKEVVEDLPNKMETQLAESGSNFSVGQRQLVCLARAVLKKNRILIIDEATANVDPRTDEFIQKTIRETFAHCTVLTIAHRLNTIIDSDRIMVLDAGRLKEYGEPYILLQEQDSLFYKMVQQVGKTEAASLIETAKRVYFSKNYPEVVQNGQLATDSSLDPSSGLCITETAL
ncbi:ATP-binding cassette sub-family C member 4 isoform X3 [Vidua macroura]|uniref:ATP-binding cassette sub-family C member 4 isoform X3 n=1 Tax=Vidua chalybeata TaxID=81927 RepID=UPI0023A8DF05|nr:ATP-binding cassette sub-family C member 4 isoform X3 [Vidua chalybeata]XP_053827628.1 ATP-binding cassette sub-family C member 4 isoform X3 [Vidua macroura]